MKNKLIAIFKDMTFLLLTLIILTNLLSLWLGYPIWWTVKYGMILFAWSTAYILVKKGNSILLVTAIIGSILAITYPFFA